MEPDILATYKQGIINKLREAGAKGLNKTQLGIKSKSPKDSAVKSLEKEQKIANLETGNKTLYVLKEFYKPLEMAYNRVEKAVLSKPGLFSKSAVFKECEKGCPGKVRKEIENAVDWLVKENKLLKLKYRNFFLYLHVSKIQSLLPAVDPVSELQAAPQENKKLPELNRERVLEAYRKVSQRVGFSNIEIYQLQQELGIPIEQLKEFLLNESRNGTAFPSFGNWQLASEASRKAAIYINGEPHLVIRFKE
jgi:hypothetical protein